jgi:hypothetical protein
MAVAAMRLSLIGIECPAARSSAKSLGIGRLGLDRHEVSLCRASQKPISQPTVGGRLLSYQAIFTAVDSLDIELLATLNAVLLPQFRR